MNLFNSFTPSSLPPQSQTGSYSWFRADTGRFLFRSSIDIYRNHFSGLILIKPTSESHRILFITETGIKVFDMEYFSPGKYDVHYCMESVNRKPLIKTLGNDFSLMLYSVSDNSRIKIFTDSRSARMVIRSTDDAGKRFCFINAKTGRVEELVKTGLLCNKVNIRFFSDLPWGPDSIAISHYNIKFNIRLTKIDEN